MNGRRLLRAAAGLALGCCMAALAQDKGNWRATSSTARAITGDITISAEKVAINFSPFLLAPVRLLEPSEVNALFDLESAAGEKGNLYRLNIPASQKFLHRNTMCGSEDTHWMATYVEGRSLHLAFFSGDAVPVFKTDAIANSTDLCGTYLYAR